MDLPGLTHTLKGQDDVHDVTKGIIEKYAAKPSTVMLVVISGHDDFGNAEALKLARKHDLSGRRTIGVVTKLDSVAKDSIGRVINSIQMTGKDAIPLQHGYIAVRNRTPQEVKDALPHAQLLQKEKHMFELDAKLSTLRPNEWGITTLLKRIVALQSQAVDSWVSKILYV
jgi:dynamin 1-like protein